METAARIGAQRVAKALPRTDDVEAETPACGQQPRQLVRGQGLIPVQATEVEIDLRLLVHGTSAKL
jgi:hypothetical protein